MRSKYVKARFLAEMGRAETARSLGNEGQARVCARRAAGILIQEYYSKTGVNTEGMSAYDLITSLLEGRHVSPQVHTILEHLTNRVDPGGNLPPGIDLIAETYELRQYLGDEDDEELQGKN